MTYRNLCHVELPYGLRGIRVLSLGSGPGDALNTGRPLKNLTAHTYKLPYTGGFVKQNLGTPSINKHQGHAFRHILQPYRAY